MKKILIAIVTLLLFDGLSYSQAETNESKAGKPENHHQNHSEHDHKKDEKHDHSDQKAQVKALGKDKLLIKVNGMVCAFCAQGVEKNFNGRDEVKSTKVDLDSMTVDIQLKKGKSLDEKTIKKLIEDAGFAYGGFVEK